MAPGLLSEQSESHHNGLKHDVVVSSKPLRQPIKASGVLDKFGWEDATPVIGREFPTLNIVDDIFNAENADELLRELAVTIAQRGVVFFRKQDNLTDELQKELVHRMGQLTNKPSTSSLHIHPILNNTSEFGVPDAEISHISSLARKKLFSHSKPKNSRRYDAATWHSDIQFEPCPADFTSLRLTQLPECGGDTLWASGYELYDRFSKPYQKFFESLTATFIGEGFINAAARDPEKVKIWTEPRGSPDNVGDELTAVHPVVRTNPVTGWKSIFACGNFPKQINELNGEESDELLKKFYRTILDNHDLTVRLKWRNPNDLAIWDNRSAFHSATFDYQGERFGHRAVGIGERPYLDPNSTSRSEDLGLTGYE
ncbi:alpha-ketoglutarate-dependent sulfonate dioxygenase [Neohortaea acidophila]|uniref:Alpha-ketoglutarate-dependent sulfonate dioxygenase n=1 Tax=Neohortaea acidophila TaxID=245834 RepID=A0A6A6PNS6_9PEZI|nr:alpha-ketoglutarate-dependent sulfonate dioxygenase [Neohortaea acidophila]KAF2481748.1 alpha-ketoglutarate-dependent sulfonate dioxygenase [Neohortaea acidophila]